MIENPCKLQVQREADVLPDIENLDVHVDDKRVFELAPGDLRAGFFEAGEVDISVRDGSRTLLQQRLALPGETRLKLSLGRTPVGLLGRILGRIAGRAPLVLHEVERGHHARYDPGPPRPVLSQIWLGTASDEAALHAFMEERKAYYSDENEDAEGTDRHIALSAFADSQDETSYDHDFLEYGFAKRGDTLEDRFAGHSWVEQWAPILREMRPRAEIEAASAYVQMGMDVSERFGVSREIAQPRDIDEGAVRLRYVGEITHPSH